MVALSPANKQDTEQEIAGNGPASRYTLTWRLDRDQFDSLFAVLDEPRPAARETKQQDADQKIKTELAGLVHLFEVALAEPHLEVQATLVQQGRGFVIGFKRNGTVGDPADDLVRRLVMGRDSITLAENEIIGTQQGLESPLTNLVTAWTWTVAIEQLPVLWKALIKFSPARRAYELSNWRKETIGQVIDLALLDAFPTSIVQTLYDKNDPTGFIARVTYDSGTAPDLFINQVMALPIRGKAIQPPSKDGKTKASADLTIPLISVQDLLEHLLPFPAETLEMTPAKKSTAGESKRGPYKLTQAEADNLRPLSTVLNKLFGRNEQLYWDLRQMPDWIGLEFRGRPDESPNWPEFKALVGKGNVILAKGEKGGTTIVLKLKDKSTWMPKLEALVNGGAGQQTPSMNPSRALAPPPGYAPGFAPTLFPTATAVAAAAAAAPLARRGETKQVDSLVDKLQALNIQPDKKDSVVKAVASHWVNNTRDWYRTAPRHIAKIPVGQGLGAVAASQAAIDSFFTATGDMQPIVKSEFDDQMELLQTIAQQNEGREVTGEWLKFTKEMRSMDTRVQLDPSAFATPAPSRLAPRTLDFSIPETPEQKLAREQRLVARATAPLGGMGGGAGAGAGENPWLHLGVGSGGAGAGGNTGGKLSIRVGSAVETTLAESISSAGSDDARRQALWTYCLENDTNACAQALYAYDSAYTSDDLLDPFVRTCAQMVILRGMFTNRHVSDNSRAILTTAAGETYDGWVSLDEKALLANPAILGISALNPVTYTSGLGPAAAFARIFVRIVKCCRDVVARFADLDQEALDEEETDRTKTNVDQALELQILATLFRLLQNPDSHASPGLVLRVGYMWRAEFDEFSRTLFDQAKEAGHLKEWVQQLKALTVRNAADVRLNLSKQNWDEAMSPQMQLVVLSLLVDSHYLNLDNDKRLAWRTMLQNTREPMTLLRAFYYMSQFA